MRQRRRLSTTKKRRVIRLRDCRTARRLLSRLAVELQETPGDRDLQVMVRLLTHLVSVFVQSVAAADFEERLTALEERATERGRAA